MAEASLMDGLVADDFDWQPTPPDATPNVDQDDATDMCLVDDLVAADFDWQPTPPDIAISTSQATTPSQQARELLQGLSADALFGSLSPPVVVQKEQAPASLAPAVVAAVQERQPPPRPPRRLPAHMLPGYKPAPLAVLHCPLKVVYARHKNHAEAVGRRLLATEKGKCLGFDIEWRVTFKMGQKPRPVALVQLCSHTAVYLLHVAHTGIVDSLKKLLEAADIGKAGVGIRNDAHKMERDFGIKMAGLVDLAALAAARVRPAPRGRSLADLTATLVKKRLPKPQNLRRGNWEVAPLSAAQVVYAAADAYAGWLLLRHLSALPRHSPPPSSSSSSSSSSLPSSTSSGAIVFSAALRPGGGGRVRPPDPHNADLSEPVLLGSTDKVSPRFVAANAALQRKCRLRPTQAEAHRLFFRDRLKVAQVAAAKGLAVNTAVSYLNQGIVAGMPYRWEDFQIGDALLALVQDVFVKHEQATKETASSSSSSAAAARTAAGTVERVLPRVFLRDMITELQSELPPGFVVRGATTTPPPPISSEESKDAAAGVVAVTTVVVPTNAVLLCMSHVERLARLKQQQRVQQQAVS